MAVQIERALDEPVVIFTFNNTLDEQTIQEANIDADDLLHTLGTFYAVLDVRELDMSSTAIAESFNQYNFVVLTEPRIAYVIVGQSGNQTNTLKVPSLKIQMQHGNTFAFSWHIASQENPSATPFKMHRTVNQMSVI